MEQQTCGKGLADHSALPLAMGVLSDATAEILEIHLKAIDPFDPGSRHERDAYDDLARRHRYIAVELRNTAEQMAASRDLPMAKHDMTFMTGPAPYAAFRRFVKEELALLELLRSRLLKDEEMLRQMTETVG